MNPFGNLIQLPIHYSTADSNYRRVVRKEYERIQEGKCWHCKQPLDGPPDASVQRAVLDMRLFPTGFFNHPVHLHHDHNTDLTIGAVHCRCNAWLWQFEGQ